MADFAYFVDKKLATVPVRICSVTHFFDARFVLDTGSLTACTF